MLAQMLLFVEDWLSPQPNKPNRMSQKRQSGYTAEADPVDLAKYPLLVYNIIHTDY